MLRAETSTLKKEIIGTIASETLSSAITNGFSQSNTQPNAPVQNYYYQQPNNTCTHGKQVQGTGGTASFSMKYSYGPNGVSCEMNASAGPGASVVVSGTPVEINLNGSETTSQETKGGKVIVYGVQKQTRIYTNDNGPTVVIPPKKSYRIITQ